MFHYRVGLVCVSVFPLPGKSNFLKDWYFNKYPKHTSAKVNGLQMFFVFKIATLNLLWSGECSVPSCWACAALLSLTCWAAVGMPDCLHLSVARNYLCSSVTKKPTDVLMSGLFVHTRLSALSVFFCLNSDSKTFIITIYIFYILGQ